jgi:HSP20 family molecular chaperone IbpA
MTPRPSHEEVVASTAETAATMLPQNVPVNAYETPGAFVIVAPIPAVTASDVSVELADHKVRFWAELRAAGPRKYVIHEWEYGGYERTVEVPHGYGDGVEATLVNGQLVIRVLSGKFIDSRPIHPNPEPRS